MRLRQMGLIAGLSGLLALPGAAWAQGVTAADPVIATVNAQPITQKEFQQAFAIYMRRTYFHRQVPEGEVARSVELVKDLLIDRLLLLSEAKRRGLQADEQAIARTIDQYDARYAGSERWKENRESMLVGVTKQLREQSVLEQLEKLARSVPDPTDKQLRDYYQTHANLFTEPEKIRMHTILLKVDPSASSAVWQAARDEALRILNNIRGGANFAEMARLHSGDASAENGGDMGYLHKGMIPDAVQAKIDELKLGETTLPLTLLEGIAIFRLDERIEPKLHAFEDVAGRAKDLIGRELSEAAWEGFLKDLRKGAEITLTQTGPLGSPVPGH